MTGDPRHALFVDIHNANEMPMMIFFVMSAMDDMNFLALLQNHGWRIIRKLDANPSKKAQQPRARDLSLATVHSLRNFIPAV